MGAVGRKVLHRHAHRAERCGDGGRQEVFSPVHPHLLRGPSRRPIRVFPQYGGAQRGQHGGAGRSTGGDGGAGDDFGGGVHEPGHPWAHQFAVGIDQQRRLHMVGLPHVIAPGERPFAEDVVRAGCVRSRGKTGPLPRGEITAHRTQERRQRRHRLQQRHRRRRRAPRRRHGSRRRRRLTVTAAGCGPGHQLAVHGGGVAVPVRQQHPDLPRDLEPATATLTGTQRGPRRAGSLRQPPPHRPLRHAQTLPRQTHMLPRQPPLAAQRQQPTHRRPPQRPQRLLAQHTRRILRRRQRQPVHHPMPPSSSSACVERVFVRPVTSSPTGDGPRARALRAARAVTGRGQGARRLARSAPHPHAVRGRAHRPHRHAT